MNVIIARSTKFIQLLKNSKQWKKIQKNLLLRNITIQC